MHLLIIIYYHCYTHNTFRNLSDDFSSHLTFMMGSSLVAQSVKSLTTMWETQVQSLGREIPWGRKWQPTPAFLPGEFHEQRSLGGYSLWGHKESDTTEWLALSLFTFMIVELSSVVLTSWQMQWWFGCLMWNWICSDPCAAADVECSLTPEQGHQHQGLFRLKWKGHWVDITGVLLIFHR